LYQQDSKGSGVTVKRNNCSQPPYLSVGTVMELAPKGRLWLKSTPSEYVNSRFQLICQNRSSDSLQVEFSGMLSPWLSVPTLCGSWVDNTLNCKAANGGQKGLYCVLSPLNERRASQSADPTRTTSVKMRELGGELRSSTGAVINFTQQKLDLIKSELYLCKSLNQIAAMDTMEWTVSTEGEVNVIKASGMTNHALLACYKAVVTTFPYPIFAKQMTFKSTF
jgi:hypothetical protein